VSEVQIIGHRGARSLLPENTIPGFQKALDLGADMIEIDVQVTSDGVAVVVHDTVLTGALCRRDGLWLPDPGIPVSSATWAELAKLDVGMARPEGPVAKSFPDQQPLPSAQIPRLSEVLAFLALQATPVLLEIKRDVTDLNALPVSRCVEAILAQIDTTSKEAADLIVQSFDWEVLAEVQRRWPSARIAALSSERGTPRTVYEGSPWLGRWADAVCRDGVAPILTENGWSTWSAAHQDLDYDIINRAHHAGLQVFAWTVSDAARARSLVTQGVDGLITDDPERISLRCLTDSP